MHLEADECGISLGPLGPFFAVQGQPMAGPVEIAVNKVQNYQYFLNI
jgi:hypothetical protein